MGLRFGLDIGVASVGWAVVNDEYEVVEAGVNIFPCADASENANRRNFRQMKRLHRRKRTRVLDFEKLWKSTGREVPIFNNSQILELRVKGLTNALTEQELYSVLKNELLHRGISYMDDAEDESNAGKNDYAKGILLNQKALENNRYPCEIQLERFKEYGQYRGNLTIEKDGEQVTLSNIYTTSAYKKELKAILDTQQKKHEFISDEFIKQYLEIFSRKREYYIGPGNENSRTDYGIYTTKINTEDGTYITEKNIFEKLIGKCSVYKEERRAASASYTAQEYNVLNDLNNLYINGRKLTKEEKIKIVDKLKNSNSINMRKIIKQVIGEDIETFSGARVDKKEKEIFHHFDQYNLIRKTFEKNDWDITNISREDFDSIGEILTLNTEKESILDGFKRKNLKFSDEQIDSLIMLRKKNSSSFNKWHSFSLKIMMELIPELYSQPKNQMELLTDMGVFKTNSDEYARYKYLPSEKILENIYNPVVARSIRITIKVINALLKKYGHPNQIIIEMPRDKNEDEEKKRIKDMQSQNEKELDDIIKKVSKEYGISITERDFYNHKKLGLKLKLWNEQDEICLYSGRKISIQDLLNNPTLFEIDHIIPKSISYDDSRTNKVLVYQTENQEKKNMTPYLYLKGLSREWTFDIYKCKVVELTKKGKLSKAKCEKLLFTEDITKIDVLQGFISRNINDTRYASRMVLNVLQSFFKAKQSDTKIRVIRGAFTHQLRNVLHLDKNRDESFVHHAVDAMIMCYSQMGLDAYRNMLTEFIDFETGEILDKEKWEEQMNDKTYDELLYINKQMRIRANIQKAVKEVKFWHKRDSKPNRGLSDQTIRGTRNIQGETMKIYKLNIYTKEGIKTLKKMIADGKQDNFLMYRYDQKSWEDMIHIMNDYRECDNPFAEYEKETGDYFRKYSKKHNGPRIVNLKYMNGKVGSCIDISHKYGFNSGECKVILETLNPYRMDVYYRDEKKAYYFVGIKYCDLKFENGHYCIDKDAYRKALIGEKLISNAGDITDLEGLGYQFLLSFYKNDIIQYEKNGTYYTERFLSRTKPDSRNYIETKPIDAPKFEKRNLVGLSKTKSVKKIRTDILGNQYICSQENFISNLDEI